MPMASESANEVLQRKDRNIKVPSRMNSLHHSPSLFSLRLWQSVPRVGAKFLGMFLAAKKSIPSRFPKWIQLVEKPMGKNFSNSRLLINQLCHHHHRRLRVHPHTSSIMSGLCIYIYVCVFILYHCIILYLYMSIYICVCAVCYLFILFLSFWSGRGVQTKHASRVIIVIIPWEVNEEKHFQLKSIETFLGF